MCICHGFRKTFMKQSKREERHIAFRVYGTGTKKNNHKDTKDKNVIEVNPMYPSYLLSLFFKP